MSFQLADASSYNSSSNGSVVTAGPLFDAVEEAARGIYIYPFVFVIVYMVVGIIGNSIVIYIFTMQWKLTKTTVFILTLAGVDIFSCIINMPVEAAILWHPLDFDIDALCKITRFTTFIASASSSFVLVAISIDRYLMVCRPFLGRELGVRYAVKTCVVAVLLGVVSTWPSLIFYGTYTFHVNAQNPQTGKEVQVEGRTCLITNYYVKHDKLPAGFYFFLFGGHVIMFLILTMVYIMIGRSLFMSTNPDIPQEKRHSLKYFGISMMSAITGSLPNTPTEGREKRSSLGSRSSRAVSMEHVHRLSMENVNRIDPVVLQYAGNGTSSARTSAETAVSIIINDDETPSVDSNKKTTVVPNGEVVQENGHIGPGDPDTCNKHATRDDLAGTKECETDNALNCCEDPGHDTIKAVTSSPTTNASNNRNHLSLHIPAHRDPHGTGQFRRSSERLSSESVGSDKSLTPMSPDSVR